MKGCLVQLKQLLHSSLSNFESNKLNKLVSSSYLSQCISNIDAPIFKLNIHDEFILNSIHYRSFHLNNHSFQKTVQQPLKIENVNSIHNLNEISFIKDKLPISHTDYEKYANEFINIIKEEIEKRNVNIKETSRKDKISILKESCNKLLQRFSPNKNMYPNNDHDTNINELNSNLNTKIRIVLSKSQRYQLVELLHCTNLNERKNLFRNINYLLENGPRGTLTEEKRGIIKEWLKAHNYRFPNTIEYRSLKERTGLSLEQIRGQILVLSDPVRKITNENKKIIIDWLTENNFKPMSFEDRKYLMNKTGLNYRQIYDFGRRYSQNPGIVDSNSKEIIREWMNKTQLLGSRMPSKEEYQDLMEKTKLNNEQIRSQIRQWRRSPVTNEKRLIILKWQEENNGRSPTLEEKNTLSELTNLSKRQITNILYNGRMKKGDLTFEIQQLLLKWLEKNQYRQPNQEEIELLQQQTELNRRQIYLFCRNMIKKWNEFDMKD